MVLGPRIVQRIKLGGMAIVPTVTVPALRPDFFQTPPRLPIAVADIGRTMLQIVETPPNRLGIDIGNKPRIAVAYDPPTRNFIGIEPLHSPMYSPFRPSIGMRQLH